MDLTIIQELDFINEYIIQIVELNSTINYLDPKYKISDLIKESIYYDKNINRYHEPSYFINDQKHEKKRQLYYYLSSFQSKVIGVEKNYLSLNLWTKKRQLDYIINLIIKKRIEKKPIIEKINTKYNLNYTHKEKNYNKLLEEITNIRDLLLNKQQEIFGSII